MEKNKERLEYLKEHFDKGNRAMVFRLFHEWVSTNVFDRKDTETFLMHVEKYSSWRKVALKATADLEAVQGRVRNLATLAREKTVA